MPVYATLFMIVMLSSLGLPTLNGFIGEFTILQGAFEENMVWAAFAVAGIVLGAAYLLWLYQRTMFGTIQNPKNEKLKDLNFREVMTLVPLIVWAFWIGLYPKPFFHVLEKPVAQIVQRVRPDYYADHPDAFGSPAGAQTANAAARGAGSWPRRFRPSKPLLCRSPAANDVSVEHERRNACAHFVAQDRAMNEYFSPGDFLVLKPVILLTLFGMGVLLTDLLLETRYKYFNAITALVGVGFASVSMWMLQSQMAAGRRQRIRGLPWRHPDGPVRHFLCLDFSHLHRDHHSDLHPLSGN